jgi:hypothetical protein
MKDIERIFKEALDQHEVPYQSGAWEAMSKRLDGTTPTPFYRKWWFAATVGTVLVSSSTYFMLREQVTKPTEQTTQTTVNPTVSINETAAPLAENNTTNNTSGTTSNTTDATSGTLLIDPVATPDQSTTTVPVDNATNKTSITNPHKGTTPNPTTPTPTTPKTPIDGERPDASYAALSLPERVCFNDTWEFTNPNDQETVYVTAPNGKQIAVKPGKTVEISANQEGAIEVLSGTQKQEIAVVRSNSKLYINIDSYVIFDNGIPTLTFKASGNENPVQWETSAKGFEVQNGDLLVHPYQDKQVTAIVRTTDMNGCPIEEKTTLRVEQTYNLMAPTGFYPNDFDQRKNRFMPYALTKRNVGFELIIVDPNNGGIVFKSNDATQGWDGIDQRTGEMVPENSVWPWRVILQQPNAGENKEYTGTITRL